MNYSLQEKLELLAPNFSSNLVSNPALINIKRLVKILPPVSYTVLECSLRESGGTVDLSVVISESKLNLSNDILANPIWQRLQKDIWKEWIDVNSYLHQVITDIWLEFDLDQRKSKPIIPCIGLTFKSNLADLKTLLITSEILLGKKINSQLSSNLERCFNALPSEGKIICLGAMLSRQSDAVRTIINGIKPTNLSSYLFKVGRNNSIYELNKTILSISNLIDNIVLSFDIGNTILPRIGLECYILDPHNFELFLDYLVSEGHCNLANQQSILNWLNSTKTNYIFDYFTNFFKIVYQPDKPLEAKYYFGFGNE